MMDKAFTLLIGGEPLFQIKEFARLSKFSLKTLLYNDLIDMLKPIRGGTIQFEKQHLGVSTSKIGLLVTVFALAAAIVAPILIALTINVDRKKLLLITLGIFIASNGQCL